jgi:tetratricopeptide (TPR) repeat protein
LRTFDWYDNYTLFASAVNVSPNSAKVHKGYGEELAARGEHEKALEHYNRVLSIIDEHKDDWCKVLVMRIHFAMAISLNEMKNREEAVWHYRSILTEYFALLEQVKQAKRGQAEVDNYVKNLRLFEGLRIELVFFNMGKAYAELRKFKEAQEALQHAIRIDNNYSEAYNALALVYGITGKCEIAEQTARKGLKVAPENPLLHNTLGVILSAAGKIEEAKREYEEALRLNPEMRQAKENLERLKTGERK